MSPGLERARANRFAGRGVTQCVLITARVARGARAAFGGISRAAAWLGRVIVRVGRAIPGVLRGLLRTVRRWAAPLVVLTALAAYAAFLPLAWIYATTGPHRGSVRDVPAAPVAVVLGAEVKGGRPSPFLAGRLDIAADLYHRGRVRAILVTGDNGSRSYDEPTAMRQYLADRGVPEIKVVRDYAGFDTWDSCVRAKRIFGVHQAIVVTQRFHVPRAVALCRAAGIDAAGIGHDTWKMHSDITRAGYVREVLASYKAVADVVMGPGPRFLGPREPGIEQALAAG